MVLLQSKRPLNPMIVSQLKFFKRVWEKFCSQKLSQLPSLSSSPIFYLVFFSLLFLPFLIYFPSLHYDFVWDDHSFLVSNKSILEDTPWAAHFVDRTTQAESPEAQIYRPIRNLSYCLEHKLLGLTPFWFHFNNILLHGLNGVLLFLLARFCFQISLSRAWILSLFFLVHPMQTEVVCWVKSRDDLLAVFFGALAFLSYHFYLKTPKLRILLPFILLYLLSLFSKESSLFLFAVFFLWAMHQKPSLPLKKKIYLFLFLALPVLAYSFFRFYALEQWGQDSFYLAGSFLKTQLGMTLIYRDYLFKILFPWDQRVNYMGYNPFSMESETTLILYGFLLLILIALLFFRASKKGRIRLSFFIFSFIPIANLIPMMQWEAERFLYFPLFFFALFLGDLIPTFKKDAVKKGALILAILYFVFLLMQTTQREKIWKNNRMLGLSMLSSNPYSYHGLVLVFEYNRQHDLHRETVQLAEETLKLFPNELLIYEYLSFAYLQLGTYDLAQQTVQKGLSCFPKAPLLLRFKAFLNTQGLT